MNIVPQGEARSWQHSGCTSTALACPNTTSSGLALPASIASSCGESATPAGHTGFVALGTAASSAILLERPLLFGTCNACKQASKTMAAKCAAVIKVAFHVV